MRYPRRQDPSVGKHSKRANRRETLRHPGMPSHHYQTTNAVSSAAAKRGAITFPFTPNVEVIDITLLLRQV